MENQVAIIARRSTKNQIDELLSSYPKLTVVRRTPSSVVIEGIIDIRREYRGFLYSGSPRIEISFVPGGPELPVVKDLDNVIERGYMHKYANKSLCLATEIDMLISNSESFSLIKLVRDYVEPYYFSYAYYKRYGELPFGDRRHSMGGIIDTYRELFKEDDEATILKLLSGIGKFADYKGHHKCFCGSGKRLRDCHGKSLRVIMNTPVLKQQAIMDYRRIQEEIAYESKRNYKETKRR